MSPAPSEIIFNVLKLRFPGLSEPELVSWTCQLQGQRPSSRHEGPRVRGRGTVYSSRGVPLTTFTYFEG